MRISICIAVSSFAVSSALVGASPAVVAEDAGQRALVDYLLGEYAQTPGIKRVLNGCVNSVLPYFKSAIALYRQKSESALTRSAQREFEARAKLLEAPETATTFCIVRSVSLIGHNSSIRTADAIRGYVENLTDNGFSRLRQETMVSRADEPGDGTLRNIEYVTVSDMFQMLNRHHDRTPNLSHYSNADMKSRFGNTVLLTGADGASVGRTYYDPDGIVTYVAPDGATAKFAWEIADDELCVSPIGKPAVRECSTFQGPKNIGDVWKSPAGSKGEVTYTLKEGRP